MPAIEILGTGRIDERESAFPMAVSLPNGDILCSYSVGGGQYVHGGTDCSRSADGGKTWESAGTILPATGDPRTANFLKLSLSADGETIYAYGARLLGDIDEEFGDRKSEPVFCTSADNGRSWSKPWLIPRAADCPLEISHGILPLKSGRLLAPMATLPVKDRFGEQVFAAVSEDGGESWPSHVVVFEDPDKRFGYFEQKLAEIAPDRLLATAWTVSLGDYQDQPDSFSISNDGGLTWGPARSTGIQGQTMTPIPLGDDRLLVLYNRRYGEQGIVATLVTFTDDAWTVRHEILLFDARARRDRPADVESLQSEFDLFAFGFPTAIRLRDGSLLATHWSVENDVCGIRWTRLQIDW